MLHRSPSATAETRAARPGLEGVPVEKKAFRTRVLATDLLTEVPRQRTGATRPAQLYRLTNPSTPVFFARTFSPRG